MNYPKPFMTTSELVNMGLPYQMLYDIAHTPGQRCCLRKSHKAKAHFLFDTEKLEKEITKQYAR